MSNVELTKRAQRVASLGRRSALSRDEQAWHSQAVCRRLIALPQWPGVRRIAGYRAFRDEIDPAAALAAAAAGGARIALPRICDAGLTLHLHAAGDALVPNRFGIEEPPADRALVEPGTLDMILVPAVAVDVRGGRLGFGRGYYDRLLRDVGAALKVAVVHDCQVVERVAMQAHDVAMDLIVSERRTLGPFTRAET